MFFFFFSSRRRHTRLQGDWSSDVCSSDLRAAAAIRKHRPQIVFAPYYNLPIGRGLGHNDHYKTGQLVSNAFNLAHLRKAPVTGDPYQARALFFYFLPPGTPPTFVVDITEYFEDWIRALDCHKTQFYNTERPR